jgi:hypothetical protein
MTDWREDRIGSALRGENPTVMARLPGGFAVMGDVQGLPGYCVLVTDDPAIDRLTAAPLASLCCRRRPFRAENGGWLPVDVVPPWSG